MDGTEQTLRKVTAGKHIRSTWTWEAELEAAVSINLHSLFEEQKFNHWLEVIVTGLKHSGLTAA